MSIDPKISYGKKRSKDARNVQHSIDRYNNIVVVTSNPVVRSHDLRADTIIRQRERRRRRRRRRRRSQKKKLVHIVSWFVLTTDRQLC